ncbi:SHOCT domain-containing protein [Vibrio rotiferianus]|uniref:SHOCT domain-containing protein n=1 Tax=Vibrio rotiferianus TaxID=190895 RepID=UPI0005EF69F8|nr:SHOCT domain-containing protein [Vibrio rotiferianus]
MSSVFWQALAYLVLIPLALLPTIIAIKKKHPYKIPIILINIFGALLWGIGWFISLVWCFILPKGSSNADEIDKLHSLKEKGAITEDEFALKKKELMQ